LAVPVAVGVLAGGTSRRVAIDVTKLRLYREACSHEILR
jgi:hypothetical protein